MQHLNLLKKIRRTEKSGRVVRRLGILMMYFMVGGTFAAIGESLGWDRRTVSRWCRRFEGCTKSADGIRRALSDRPRSGRPAKISKKHQEEARKWCEGRAFSIPELADKLEELSGVKLSHGHVRRQYARPWGYSRKKSQPMKVGRASMEAVYSWRHRLLERIAEYKKQGYAIVSQDEAHFRDAARTARYWARTCLRIFLHWTGDNHRFSMFCSLTDTGKAFFNHADVIDTKSFLEHIEQVHKKVGKMVLILDRAPWHTSAEALEFFRTHGIVVMWYPVGHPYLNPVEEVWNAIKRQIHHSIRYADKMTHLKAFYEFVDGGHKFDYDFASFWKRRAPKGVTRPIVRSDGDETDPSITARKVEHKPRRRRC